MNKRAANTRSLSRDTSDTDRMPVFLVDIDGTLTHDRPAPPSPPPPVNPLVGLLMARGLPPDAAQRRVRQAELAAAPRPGGAWPFGAETLLDLDGDAVKDYVLTVFPVRYAMYPDAARFMHALRTLPGQRVYPATTNPGLYILGKLAAGGLAGRSGVAVFDACFGGEEVCAGGKSGPGFYRALCRRIGVAPAHCIMVGDDPIPDDTYARAAGIERVVIVRRDQTEPRRIESSGTVVVNRLDEVLLTQPDAVRRERP